MAIELSALPRTELGKQEMKKLRAENRLPANIYGGELTAPRAITLDLHETELMLREHGKKGDFAVVLEGRTYPVQIQEVEKEPLYKHLLHIDFVVRSNG
jgi:large subunit ribosomal protein L25